MCKLEFKQMRTRSLVAATAALLTVASAAYAANAHGTVESYDPEERLLVLDSGTAFTLSARVQETDLTPGDQVQIVWNGFRLGIRIANTVRVTVPAEENAGG
jgi:hypothetical protein